MKLLFQFSFEIIDLTRSRFQVKLPEKWYCRNDQTQSMMRSLGNIFSICSSNKLSRKCSRSCFLADWNGSDKYYLLSHWSKWAGISFEIKIVAYSTFHSQVKLYDYCSSNTRPNVESKSFSCHLNLLHLKMWMKPGHIWKCWRYRYLK